MDLDQNVAWNPQPPVTTGDYVIYSSRRGDVPFQDPGDIKGARRIGAWYRANQASTFLVQVRLGSSWVTINGAGRAVTANTICLINEDKPLGGDFRLVVNFGVAPTTFERSNAITLGVANPPELGFVRGRTGPVSVLTNAAFAFNMAPVPAKRIVSDMGRFVIHAQTGVATGNLTVKLGTNAAHDNVLAAGAIGPASTFNGVTVWPWHIRIAAWEAQGGMPLFDAPLFMEITSPIGGSSLLTVDFIFTGLLYDW